MDTGQPKPDSSWLQNPLWGEGNNPLFSAGGAASELGAGGSAVREDAQNAATASSADAGQASKADSRTTQNDEQTSSSTNHVSDTVVPVTPPAAAVSANGSSSPRAAAKPGSAYSVALSKYATAVAAAGMAKLEICEAASPVASPASPVASPVAGSRNCHPSGSTANISSHELLTTFSSVCSSSGSLSSPKLNAAAGSSAARVSSNSSGVAGSRRASLTSIQESRRSWSQVSHTASPTAAGSSTSPRSADRQSSSPRSSPRSAKPVMIGPAPAFVPAPTPAAAPKAKSAAGVVSSSLPRSRTTAAAGSSSSTGSAAGSPGSASSRGGSSPCYSSHAVRKYAEYQASVQKSDYKKLVTATPAAQRAVGKSPRNSNVMTVPTRQCLLSSAQQVITSPKAGLIRTAPFSSTLTAVDVTSQAAAAAAVAEGVSVKRKALLTAPAAAATTRTVAAKALAKPAAAAAAAAVKTSSSYSSGKGQGLGSTAKPAAAAAAPKAAVVTAATPAAAPAPAATAAAAASESFMEAVRKMAVFKRETLDKKAAAQQPSPGSDHPNSISAAEPAERPACSSTNQEPEGTCETQQDSSKPQLSTTAAVSTTLDRAASADGPRSLPSSTVQETADRSAAEKQQALRSVPVKPAAATLDRARSAEGPRSLLSSTVQQLISRSTAQKQAIRTAPIKLTAATLDKARSADRSGPVQQTMDEAAAQQQAIRTTPIRPSAATLDKARSAESSGSVQQSLDQAVAQQQAVRSTPIKPAPATLDRCRSAEGPRSLPRVATLNSGQSAAVGKAATGVKSPSVAELVKAYKLENESPTKLHPAVAAARSFGVAAAAAESSESSSSSADTADVMSAALAGVASASAAMAAAAAMKNTVSMVGSSSSKCMISSPTGSVTSSPADAVVVPTSSRHTAAAAATAVDAGLPNLRINTSRGAVKRISKGARQSSSEGGNPVVPEIDHHKLEDLMSGSADSVSKVFSRSRPGADLESDSSSSPRQAKRRSHTAVNIGGSQKTKSEILPRFFFQPRVLLPVLLLLVVVGIGVGAGLSVHKQRAAAAAHMAAAAAAAQAHAAAGLDGESMSFKIDVVVPAVNAEEGCQNWFGNSKRVVAYRRIFAAAYSKALSLPLPESAVTSIICGGKSMFDIAAEGPPKEPLPASFLFAHDAASASSQRVLLQLASDQAMHVVRVTTHFTVPSPAEQSERTHISEIVKKQSVSVLSGPLSAFFGTPSLWPAGIGDLSDVLSGKSQPPPGHRPAAAAAAGTKPAAPAAAVAAPLLTFQVVMGVPAMDEKQSCVSWFGSSERIDTYKSLFAESFAAALHVPLQQTVVKTVACSNETVYIASSSDITSSSSSNNSSSSSSSSVRPARSLIEANPAEPEIAGILQQLLTGKTLTIVEIVTKFSLPAPHNITSKQELTELVTAQASKMLSGPLSQFFSVSKTLVNVNPATAKPNPDNLGAQFNTAPTCQFQPTRSNSVADSQGRLWSMQDGKECVFRAQKGPKTAPKNFTWQDAPSCTGQPTINNSMADENNRLWGWQAGHSCVFRDKAPIGGKTTSAKPAAAAAAKNGNKAGGSKVKVGVVWEAAPSCSVAPTAENSEADTFGRLWGWENDNSCAFRWESLVA